MRNIAIIYATVRVLQKLPLAGFLHCHLRFCVCGLADRVAYVLGADLSPKCIDRAREMHPELAFAILDAVDVMAIRELPHRFSAIYLDLSGFSGYRALLDLIALLRMYETVLQPEVVVVKSGGLKRFLERSSAWPAG